MGIRHNEAKSQRAVIQWWAFSHRILGCPEFLLFAVPNGGKRGIREASLMKMEGCRAGAPDLLLLVPKAPYHGLVLEMKSADGRVRPEQKVFLASLSDQGYKVVIARSTEGAVQAITNYMRGNFTNETPTAQA